MNECFVAFEGVDGTGKSFWAEWLRNELEVAGVGVTLTREPGATPTGSRLRQLLLEDLPKAPDPDAPDPWTEALLFAADQAENVSKVIRPALQRGEYVVADRFYGSSLAYQGGLMGCDHNDLMRLTELSLQGVWPGLVIVLDADPRVVHPGGSDRYEAASMAGMDAVREAYLRNADIRNDWVTVWVDWKGSRRSKRNIEFELRRALRERLGWPLLPSAGDLGPLPVR